MKTLAVLLCLGMTLAHADDDAEYGTGYDPSTEIMKEAAPGKLRYRAFLPQTVDLSAQFPPVGSQGQQGSCVAWATGYALRSYHEGRARRLQRISSPDQILSPAYIFNRLQTGGECKALSISQALAFIQKEGVAPLSRFPYTPLACVEQPDTPTRDLAAQFRISEWHRLSPERLDEAKAQLAIGNPVVFGMKVGPAFKAHKGDGVFDDVDAPTTSGHAMVIVGYDDARQAFRIMNSWGTRWGDNGFAWVSYRAMKRLTDTQYVMEVELPPEPEEQAPSVAGAGLVTALPIATPVSVPPAQLLARVAERSGKTACARIEASMAPGGTVKLAGFVGSASDLDALRRDVGKITGALPAVDGVAIKPWPACEVLLNFASELNAPQGLTVNALGGQQNVFHEGDAVAFEVTTPSFPSYVYVSYIQAGGDVTNLVWSQPDPSHAIAPNTRIRLGSGAAKQATYRIGPPFGNEMVVVVASDTPLFKEALNSFPNDRDYLTSFRSAFALPGTTGNRPRVVAASVASIVTRPRQN